MEILEEKDEEWYRETMIAMLARQVNGVELLKFIDQAEKDHAPKSVMKYFSVIRMLDSGDMPGAQAAVAAMQKEVAAQGGEKPWYLEDSEIAIGVPMPK